VIVIPSRRHHRHYIQVRPFHYGYPRYKRLYRDDHFWGWLAFTAITLQILDNLNDEQQRAHERALYRATTSPLGQTLVWSEGEVNGSVTPVWEGPSDSGQYCREYQHEITVGDRTEVAYGTACRQADGSWEIVQ
jgi:surface antigen